MRVEGEVFAFCLHPSLLRLLIINKYDKPVSEGSINPYSLFPGAL
jgi:hypothetical protein